MYKKEIPSTLWYERAFKYIKIFSKFLLPCGTIFVASWLGFIKIPIVCCASPNYGVIVIFFWSLYYPALIPLGALLLMGIINDVISGNSLGQTAFLWILLSMSVLSQRRFFIKEPFLVIWSSFAVTFCLYLCVEWIFVAVLRNHREMLLPISTQFLTTIGIYPFITFFLIYMCKGMPVKIFKEI